MHETFQVHVYEQKSKVLFFFYETVLERWFQLN